MKPRIQFQKPTLVAAITGLVVLPLAIAQAQTTIISDFNDGAPDWEEKQVRGVDFAESGGYLVASGDIPAGGNNCITWNNSHVRWYQTLSAAEGEILRLNLDLIEASHNDVPVLLQYQTVGTGGYALFKDEDEIWLSKYPWADCGANAPFFYEQVQIKNERVRLVLELKRANVDLEITAKVLDLDDESAVLFSKTVIDTPAVDPTISSFRGYSWSPDPGPPMFDATAVSVSVLNVASTSQSNVYVALDNLTRERLPVLNVERAVRLSWPASFPNMEVYGAPTVEGPWTMISETVVESDGEFLMTVPTPLSDSYEYYRLQQP